MQNDITIYMSLHSNGVDHGAAILFQSTDDENRRANAKLSFQIVGDDHTASVLTALRVLYNSIKPGHRNCNIKIITDIDDLRRIMNRCIDNIEDSKYSYIASAMSMYGDISVIIANTTSCGILRDLHGLAAATAEGTQDTTFEEWFDDGRVQDKR